MVFSAYEGHLRSWPRGWRLAAHTEYRYVIWRQSWNSCDLDPSCTLRTGRMFLFLYVFPLSLEIGQFLLLFLEMGKLCLDLWPCSLCFHHLGRYSICKTFFSFKNTCRKSMDLNACQHDDVQPGHELCFTCFNSVLWQIPNRCPTPPPTPEQARKH